MRKIKFRAWDTGTKEMFIGIDNIKEHYEGIVLFDELLNPKEAGCPEIELMQFTGLKDKNGKEIFEGDVVKYRDSNWIVRFEMGSFSLFTNIKNLSKSIIKKPETDEEKLANELGVWWTRCEVIGNKFENPELLKVK